jgi:hypothetical protein
MGKGYRPCPSVEGGVLMGTLCFAHPTLLVLRFTRLRGHLLEDVVHLLSIAVERFGQKVLCDVHRSNLDVGMLIRSGHHDRVDVAKDFVKLPNRF